MADLTITINPPTTNTITISDGILPHNLSHAPAGSDSLASWYATVDNLTYVSGQIGTPAGVVYTTGNQDISGVKNFFSRPTVDGSGVMLFGEIPGTGYLTGYVQVSQTGSFVTSGNTGNFVTSAQTGQLTGTFYPYTGNPAAYVQGAVVRPSNTGNFVDTNSFQTISGQKAFTKTITAPTGTFGNAHSLGGSNADGQTVCGGTANTTRNSHSSVLGGTLNFATENYSCTAGGIGNIASGQSAFIGGGSGNVVEDCIGAAVVGGENNSSKLSNYSLVAGGIQNSIYNSLQSRTLGGFANVISGGVTNITLGEQNVLIDCGQSIAIGSSNTATRCNTTLLLGNFISATDVESALVASDSSPQSSGSNTAVIAYSSGIYLNGPTHFNNRPTYNGTGFLLSGEASIPSTGYLTGYVNKSETGDFYPRSNPSGYITGVDLSAYALSANTGAFLTTGAADTRYVSQGSTGLFVPYNGATGTVNLGTQSLITHSVKADSSDGLILASNNGTTGIVVGAGGSANATVYGALKLDYTTADKVPVFDSLKNLVASNVVTGELNYLTGVTSSIQTQFGAITNSTGSFLTTGAADLRYVGLTGDQNVSGVKNFVSRPTVGGTGVMLSGESSPVTLQATYDNSSTTEILTDSTRGALTLKRGSAADTDAVLEILNNAGTATLSTKGNGETTLTLNALTTTTTPALILANTTAAISGTQQYSPSLKLSGSLYTTGTGSKTLNYQFITKAVQYAGSFPIGGGTPVVGYLEIAPDIDGDIANLRAVYAGYNKLRLDPHGTVWLNPYSGLGIAIGSTPEAGTPAITINSSGGLTFSQNHILSWVTGFNALGTVSLSLSRDAAQILAQSNGANAQTFRIYGTTTGSKYLSLAHDGTNAVISASSGLLTLTTATSISANLTANGAFISTPQALSGAGAVNVTTLITKITSTGVLDALTLADGVDGQIKIISHVVDGGSALLTPTTKTGFTTITFTNAGESATLVFYTTVGWMIQSLYGAIAA